MNNVSYQFSFTNHLTNCRHTLDTANLPKLSEQFNFFFYQAVPRESDIKAARSISIPKKESFSKTLAVSLISLAVTIALVTLAVLFPYTYSLIPIIIGLVISFAALSLSVMNLFWIHGENSKNREKLEDQFNRLGNYIIVNEKDLIAQTKEKYSNLHKLCEDFETDIQNLKGFFEGKK